MLGGCDNHYTTETVGTTRRFSALLHGCEHKSSIGLLNVKCMGVSEHRKLKTEILFGRGRKTNNNEERNTFRSQGVRRQQISEIYNHT